jgi:hypothetical protein
MADPMPGKPNDFIVRLDGLKLDEAARHRISSAIQAAVLSELGTIDLTGRGPTGGLAFIPIKWKGLWLREVARLPELGDFGKTLGVTEQGVKE